MSIQPVSTESQKPFQLLTIEEAAEFLRTPVATLRFWRHQNKGPKAARIGSRIFYRKTDLDQFINEQFDNA